MARRRLLLFFASLLVVTAIASAVAPRERTNERGTAPVPRVAAGPPAGVVERKLPSAKPIVAKVGDVVRLTAEGTAVDELQIPDLAVNAPLDEGVPAELEFVADRPGRFAVVLRDAEKRLATLDVRPAG